MTRFEIIRRPAPEDTKFSFSSYFILKGKGRIQDQKKTPPPTPSGLPTVTSLQDILQFKSPVSVWTLTPH